MKTIKKIIGAGALAAAASVFLLQPFHAQAADDYYKGKTIRFIVGFGAGGGYDSYSRMLAPHFEKILGASVVVENQPGAGGLSALNRFTRAPGNGLQMTIVNGTGASLMQLLDMKGVRFDLLKMGYLGIIDHSRWLWLMSPKSKIKTVQDAFKSGKTLTWGGSGKISGMTDGAAMSCATLRLNCKVVGGYKGSRAAALAVAQGEMDAIYVSETSAFRYVQAKNAIAVATMNRERSILFPNLPTIFEQVKLNKDQQWWVDYRATVESLGRILVVPPSTPPNLVKKLRDATHKILTDPKIVAEANKKKRYIKYIPADDAKKRMERILNGVTAEQKARIKKVVLGKS